MKTRIERIPEPAQFVKRRLSLDFETREELEAFVGMLTPWACARDSVRARVAKHLVDACCVPPEGAGAATAQS